MSDDTENYEELARWNEACRREEAIRGLLERYPKSLNGQAVADLAWELDLSRATLYRMIKLFPAGGTVSSLMDRKRGRRQGHRALDKDREAVVRRTIEGFYLKPTRPSFARLVREVQIDCSTAGPLELVQIDHTKVDVATQTSSRFSRTARRQHS